MGITRSFSAERVLTIHADTSRGLDYGPRPEHVLVHDRPEDTAEERTEPVHPPVVEEAGCDRGAEPPPGAHRGRGEVPAEEPVDADGEAHRDRPRGRWRSPGHAH